MLLGNFPEGFRLLRAGIGRRFLSVRQVTTNPSENGNRPRILALFGSIVLFGQERGNLEALSALRESGHEVRCIVRSDRWNRALIEELEARGLEYVTAPYLDLWREGRKLHFIFRNPFVFVAAQFIFLFHYLQYRPSLIYVFNPVFFANFLLALCLVRAPLLYRAGDEPTLHNSFWRLIWRIMRRRIARLVANSEFVRESCVTAGVAAGRISVIYNRPPRRFSHGSDSHSIDRTGDRPTFLYLGQMTKEKGVDLLIEAFSDLVAAGSDARLLLAGELPNATWAQSLRAEVDADPVANERIQFLGYVHDVDAVLRAADIHVAPSMWEEPLGNVVFEAKAIGLPSIVFPSGGLVEIVNHLEDGYICRDRTKEALLEALHFYQRDRDIASSHGTAARASLSRLGCDRFGEQWQAAVRAVLLP